MVCATLSRTSVTLFWPVKSRRSTVLESVNVAREAASTFCHVGRRHLPRQHAIMPQFLAHSRAPRFSRAGVASTLRVSQSVRPTSRAPHRNSLPHVLSLFFPRLRLRHLRGRGGSSHAIDLGHRLVIAWRRPAVLSHRGKIGRQDDAFAATRLGANRRRLGTVARLVALARSAAGSSSVGRRGRPSIMLAIGIGCRGQTARTPSKWGVLPCSISNSWPTGNFVDEAASEGIAIASSQNAMVRAGSWSGLGCSSDDFGPKKCVLARIGPVSVTNTLVGNQGLPPAQIRTRTPSNAIDAENAAGLHG